MSNEITSEGKCLYCEQLLPKKEIQKHLAKHLVEKEKAEAGSKTQTYCHIVVEADVFFLHLLVKGSAKLERIDSFLRNIWLECCGHMSAFELGREEVLMNKKAQEVFAPTIKLKYDYDFGSTTRLQLKGLKHYQLQETEDVILLSRNEPLKLMCATCEKEPAVYICSVCCCSYSAVFCKKCAKKHEKECEDFADYSKMPIVNSPRMGVCGYDGGHIDLKRDGVYKLK